MVILYNGPNTKGGDNLNYQEMNAQTINEWVKDGWTWGQPIDHATFVNAQRGQWSLVLTPLKSMPQDWLFTDMHAKQVLGLASGGGQQMPVLAALGAACTVLDYASEQLDAERLVAKREGYPINIVQADMTQPLPFADNQFDLIIQPVANCYVAEIKPIWRECYRVLKPGGRLLVGMDNGINYLVDPTETKIMHGLPYNPLKEPALLDNDTVKEDGVQFSHTLEEQLRGQLQAGFAFHDMYEDTNSDGRLAELGIPTFWATYAVKPL